MEFFDSHAHYNDEKFEEDRNEILTKVKSENVTKITCAGYNIKSSKLAVNLSKQYDFLYATVGISPNDIDDVELDKIGTIQELAQNDKVVAIGEIGLDYYWNKENKEKQKEFFVKQI